jgi:hypothetical protein
MKILPRKLGKICCTRGKLCCSDQQIFPPQLAETLVDRGVGTERYIPKAFLIRDIPTLWLFALMNLILRAFLNTLHSSAGIFKIFSRSSARNRIAAHDFADFEEVRKSKDSDRKRLAKTPDYAVPIKRTTMRDSRCTARIAEAIFSIFQVSRNARSASPRWTHSHHTQSDAFVGRVRGA